MSEYISLFSVAILVNYTSEFRERFQATAYQIPFILWTGAVHDYVRSSPVQNRVQLCTDRQTDRQTALDVFNLLEPEF